MGRTGGTGLWMDWTDIEPQHEEAFDEWSHEHIRQVLEVFELLSAGRYVALMGVPKYRAMYELERPDVPESAEWKEIRESNPWIHQIRPHMRLDDGSPSVYRCVDPGEAR